MRAFAVRAGAMSLLLATVSVPSRPMPPFHVDFSERAIPLLLRLASPFRPLAEGGVSRIVFLPVGTRLIIRPELMGRRRRGVRVVMPEPQVLEGSPGLRLEILPAKKEGPVPVWDMVYEKQQKTQKGWWLVATYRS